ncbi:hypothetical protein YC2023_047842 [Brassica napus]
MLENGVSVDKFSLSLGLKACSRLVFVKGEMKIHGFVRKTGTYYEMCSIECRRDSIIDGYIQCGLIESKEEEYKTMFNLSSYSLTTSATVTRRKEVTSWGGNLNRATIDQEVVIV